MSVKIWNGEKYVAYDTPASVTDRGTVKIEGSVDSQTNIPVVPTTEKVASDLKKMSDEQQANINQIHANSVTDVRQGSKKGEFNVTKNGVQTVQSVGQAENLLVPENLSCPGIGTLRVEPSLQNTKDINLIPGITFLDALPVENGGTNATSKGTALINLGVYSGTTDPAKNANAKNALDGCIYFQLG